MKNMMKNEQNTEITYLRDIVNAAPFQWKRDLLWWQELGLSYTSTGYGRKIPTTRKVQVNGRWYRLYVMIFSNSGSCYIVHKGRTLFVSDCDLSVVETRPFTQGEIDDVFTGYLDCLTWVEYVHGPNDPESGSETHVEDSDHYWEKRSLKIMRDRVVGFMQSVSREDFDAYCEARSAKDFGHDLYLTTHGHGAGFWDRGLGDLGKRLTAVAEMHRTDTHVHVYRNKLRIAG